MENEFQQPMTADQWKAIGNEAFKCKKYSKAIQAYTEAIKLNSEDHSFYSNRAICHYNLKNYQESINDANQSLKYNPTFVKALRRRAMSQVQLLKFDDAIASYAQAYQIDKDISINNQLETVQSYKTNYDRYGIHMEQGQYDDALKCINYLVHKIPNNDILKLYQVESLAKTGATDDALTLLKTIPQNNTENSQFWYLKGIIELYGGDSQRGKKFLVEGMRLDPENCRCRNALNKAKKCEFLKQEGNELIKAHKFEEAYKKYTEAILMDPANKKLNSVIYSNRAVTWTKRKQNLKALDDLNRSLELNPNYTKSLMRRAEINMERGDYTAAIMDYSKIQSLDSTANLKQKITDAKKKQKLAKKKEYYKILQIDRNADQDQIKKSYKKLALKYHPDRNSGKSQAEQDEASRKFKDIAEAYGVLTDLRKKQLYDSGKIEYDGDESYDFGGFGGGFGSFGGFGGPNIDDDDIFHMFFGGMGMGMGGMGGMGGKKFHKNKHTFNFKFG